MRLNLPPLAPPFAFAGVAVQRGGDAASFHIQTAPGIHADEASFWRAASISKVVVGQTLRAVVGQAPPYMDVSDLLVGPLRNPRCPDVPITIDQVVSHTSGLCDAAGYTIPDGQSVTEWIAAQGAACFSDAAPGTRFEYCNLGYLVMAALAETVTGERFDRLAQRHVLGRWGVEAGFNWAGLGSDVRARALPTYRWDGSAFAAQIDHAVAPVGMSGADGQEAVVGYEIGRDVASLSPQGGLRLSLAGAVKLARALADMDRTALASARTCAIETFGGLYESYGWGVQVFDTPVFYPRPLIGHFANAYGFVGGVWYDVEADVAFAYALNGLAMGDESDAWREEERLIFASVAAAAKEGAVDRTLPVRHRSGP